jgi:uncharacterized protein
MTENKSHFTLYNKSPLLQLAVTIIIIMTVGMALLTVLAIVGIIASGFDFQNISDNFLTEIGEKNIGLLRYLMITQDIALFIVPAIIVRKMLLPESQASLNDFGLPGIYEISLVIVLAFCLFPVTGITGRLNQAMTLPDWLSGVEKWIQTRENEATGIFDLLLPSKKYGVLFINLIVIAMVPALSEELIFRGVFQRIFHGFFKSCHPAVWLIAFIFSAIHLQFYGFIPRFILGLVFGYLYYWGGTLWLPVIAHFVNNAFPVIWSFVNNAEKATSQPEITIWKQLILLPVPVIICGVILLYFRNKKRNDPGLNKSRYLDI